MRAHILPPREMKKQMDKIFVLTSVTYAMKARDVLTAENIPAILTREAAIKKIRSCGYGIRVASRDAERAASIIENSGIHILGVTEASVERKGR